MSAEPVTRDDLEAKFRELETEANETAQQARSYVVAAVAVAAVAVLGLAYLAGRRKGRKRSTVVEIKRI